uniref:NmrA-like domain-containing protein n=1 Tax=Chlamydomonas euryale TaxID=1486919 RepID=A0A7R9W0Z6_9CHLO|mmetsp:Transcript_9222/g.28055  ORF Transcript_9222/g.28055 Transcript_9222/m.28055 type:complete len:308 (+) Transcript_9222:358-1281(+)
MRTILVASGTSNTGSLLVQTLSASGKANVRALTRNLESEAAKKLAGLPNVTLVKGDFGDVASLKSALSGVDRAYLVAQPGDETQFDNEAAFLQAAKDAGIQGTVRVSTCQCLISLDTPCVYARCHAKLEQWSKDNDARVCDISPNMFMSNLYWQLAEIKSASTFTLPCPAATKHKFGMIDPRDVAGAAEAILMSDDAKFAEFMDARHQNVAGPELTDYEQQLAALSEATGKVISAKTVAPEEYAAMFQAAGLSKLMAESFTLTVQTLAGEVEPRRPHADETSPLLAGIWQPKYTVKAWAKDNAEAFK